MGVGLSILHALNHVTVSVVYVGFAGAKGGHRMDVRGLVASQGRIRPDLGVFTDKDSGIYLFQILCRYPEHIYRPDLYMQFFFHQATMSETKHTLN